MSDRRPFTRKIRVFITQGATKILDKDFDMGPITMGRSPKTDIHLDFDFVSRAHAVITQEGERFYLTDLKSSNGILVDGKKIEKIEISNNGATVVIGKLRLQIQPAQAPVTKKMPEAPVPSVSDSEHTAVTMMGAKIKEESVKMPGTGSLDKPERVTGQPARSKKIEIKPIAHAEVRAHHSEGGHGMPRYRHEGSGPMHNGEQRAVLARKFAPDFIDLHGSLATAKEHKLEAVVTWHDQFYDVKEFGRGESLTVGPKGLARLPIPTLKQSWALASVGFNESVCQIPQGSQVTLSDKSKNIPMGDLIANQILKRSEFGYSMRITEGQVAHVDLGHGMQVHLRYVPASKAFPNVGFIEPEAAFRQTIAGSGALHITLALILWAAAPEQRPVPKIKNVPERFARMLMEKPKPKPTPTPPPKKIEEPKIAKKEPPKKVAVKPPKPVPIPKKIAKMNKFPMEVKHPLPKAPPPVKVEALGALGALGAISNKATPNVVTNININPNAGGLPQKAMNTGGIVGALPSSNGQLMAGGGGPVKTKGMGYGTGTGYGIQGLKGKAGARAVAGAVVGAPKLAQSARPEGLSRAQVMAVVQKYLGEVQQCYERNLLSNPNLAGRMEFEWDISPSGGVTSVRVKRSTVQSGDVLGECVKGIFASMQFPRATNGMTTTPNIGFPFGRL